MAKVTKESLEKKIKQLSSRSNPEFGLGLTLNEEYQLSAYKMLLMVLKNEPTVFMGVFQDGRGVAYYHTAKAANKDGADEIIPLYEDITDE